uniref:Uncharacterized protein n=1 Tax=Glossina austeni TaxID=7395 RepID=A0A1A9UZ92_GLOAU
MVLLYSLQIVIGSFLIAKANSALYRFAPEYDEIYDDCDHKPDLGGYSDFVDVSETNVIADDEGIHFNGTVTIVWDVKETDRITSYVELEKFVRGTWQPTVFSALVPDLCKEMFDTASYVYSVWTRYVFPGDRRCMAKGVRYRHEPFSVSVEFEALVNMEGRYRGVTTLRAYDENNRLKPNAICMTMPGDIVKVRQRN